MAPQHANVRATLSWWQKPAQTQFHSGYPANPQEKPKIPKKLLDKLW
jgi:hypothetical protein